MSAVSACGLSPTEASAVDRGDVTPGEPCPLNTQPRHYHNEGSSCCRRCGIAWTGFRACHCAACHETFGGVNGFDLHRVGGECVDPSEVGLAVGSRGLWSRTYGGSDE